MAWALETSSRRLFHPHEIKHHMGRTVEPETHPKKRKYNKIKLKLQIAVLFPSLPSFFPALSLALYFSLVLHYLNAWKRLNYREQKSWQPPCHAYVAVQFYPWLNFYFPLFFFMLIYDNEINIKQKKIKIEPRIKLNYNTYIIISSLLPPRGENELSHTVH